MARAPVRAGHEQEPPGALHPDSQALHDAALATDAPAVGLHCSEPELDGLAAAWAESFRWTWSNPKQSQSVNSAAAVDEILAPRDA